MSTFALLENLVEVLDNAFICDKQSTPWAPTLEEAKVHIAEHKAQLDYFQNMPENILEILRQPMNAKIEATLAEYGYPANPKNAARAGWTACYRAVRESLGDVSAARYSENAVTDAAFEIGLPDSKLEDLLLALRGEDEKQ